MALIKPKPEPPSYIWLILGLVCLNYFCMVFFLHTFRSQAAFMSPFFGLSPLETSKLASITSFIYLPSIFLGPFAGVVTDFLSPEIAMLVFSSVALCGIFLLWWCSLHRAPLPWYYVAMAIYGVGSNPFKVPMQKISSVLFAGKHFAFALTLTQLFSHAAGMLNSWLSPLLLRSYSISNFILILLLISSLALPVILVLVSLTMSRSKVSSDNTCAQKKYRQSLREKNKLRILRKNPPSLGVALRLLFQEIDLLFILVLLMGFFIDSTQVCYKNIESFIYKEVFELSEVQTGKILLGMKAVNLVTPFTSLLIGVCTYRQWYFFLSTGFMLGAHIVIYLAYLKKIGLKHWQLIVLGAFLRLVFSLFQDAFYSFFAISMSGRVRSIGFGLILSINSFGHTVMPFFYSYLRMGAYVYYLGFFVMGFLLSIVVFGMNYYKGDVMNKDRDKKRRSSS